MRDVLVVYDDRIIGDDGLPYAASACGEQQPDGRWFGWFEFTRVKDADRDHGQADLLATPRETVQPNRRDLEYWTLGITHVFLQGALRRAMAANGRDVVRTTEEIRFADRREVAPPSPRSVLDPFLVFAQGGERLLRQELGAMAPMHLRAILASVKPDARSAQPGVEANAPALIREILDAVLEQIPRPRAGGAEPPTA